jgi:transcriptional regulatory protein RtcR
MTSSRVSSRLGTGPRPSAATRALDTVLSASQRADLDPFDRVQLEEVVRVCQRSRSLSDAGRALFAVSRTKKASSNDADRLRKYLARFDLRFEHLVA